MGMSFVEFEERISENSIVSVLKNSCRKRGRVMRLIDAEYLYKLLDDEERYGYLSHVDVVLAPTIEAEPVVHGEWINGECSRCGSGIATDCTSDFIPNEDNRYCYYCGAKMNKESN